MALWRHKIFRKCLGSLFWRVEKVSAPGEQPHWYAVCQTTLYCLYLPIVARPAKFSLAPSTISKLLPGKGSFSLLLCMHTLCDNMQAVGGGQRLLSCGWECAPSNQGNHGNHICSTDDAHNLLKVVWLTTSGAHTKREWQAHSYMVSSNRSSLLTQSSVLLPGTQPSTHSQVYVTSVHWKTTRTVAVKNWQFWQHWLEFSSQ